MIGILLLVVLADDHGVDLTPIIGAIAAAILSGGGVGWYTSRNTNRRLQAEGEKLYQEALLVAEERGEKAVATVERVSRAVEERLSRAERELADARRQLALTEEKVRRLEAQADAVRAERDRVVAEARHEREMLTGRVHELEQQVDDLIALNPSAHRRRRDRGTAP